MDPRTRELIKLAAATVIVDELQQAQGGINKQADLASVRRAMEAFMRTIPPRPLLKSEIANVARQGMLDELAAKAVRSGMHMGSGSALNAYAGQYPAAARLERLYNYILNQEYRLPQLLERSRGVRRVAVGAKRNWLERLLNRGDAGTATRLVNTEPATNFFGY